MSTLQNSDNLKILVPVLIGFIGACVGLISAIAVAVSSYVLGKRTEINKLRIGKGYALAEKIAHRIEQIERSYLYFEAFWKGNYGHVSFGKGIANFNSKQVLFAEQYAGLQALAKSRHKLGMSLLGAWLYLPEPVVKSAHEYIDIGSFDWKDDAAGLFDDYHERFFENLLDPNKKVCRRKAYEKAKKRLARIKL